MNNPDSLNDFLFEQLERLNDIDDPNSDTAKAELNRAKAVTNTANSIISNWATSVNVMEVVAMSYAPDIHVPKMLDVSNG